MDDQDHRLEQIYRNSVAAADEVFALFTLFIVFIHSLNKKKKKTENAEINFGRNSVQNFVMATSYSFTGEAVGDFLVSMWVGFYFIFLSFFHFSVLFFFCLPSVTLPPPPTPRHALPFCFEGGGGRPVSFFIFVHF